MGDKLGRKDSLGRHCSKDVTCTSCLAGFMAQDARRKLDGFIEARCIDCSATPVFERLGFGPVRGLAKDAHGPKCGDQKVAEHRGLSMDMGRLEDNDEGL